MDYDDVFLYHDDLDGLVREAKYEHLRRHGVDDWTAREMSDPLFDKHYDNFAQLIKTGMSSEDANAILFEPYSPRYTDNTYHDSLRYGMSHDMAKTTTDHLDIEQKSVLMMYMRAGYDPIVAYEKALTTDLQTAIHEIADRPEIEPKKTNDDVLRERFERVKE